MQRRSAFPPLLVLDTQQVAGDCIRSSNARPPQRPVGGTTRSVAAQHEPQQARKSERRTVRSQREEELRQKRYARAEALVKKWDSLLVKEKEDRHTQLLQRMALQQKLISKNDLLFKQAEREAMEKREKEIQLRRDEQKQMIQKFRDHNKRIKEHKKMVAEKLQEARLSTANPQPSSSPPSPEELRHMADTVEETEMGQETPDEFSTDQYSFKAGRTSRLQQMMNFDPIREATPTIANTWTMLKYHHTRRLEPIVEYSLQMRRTANPTSRHLLRCYDNPVRLDSKTGERVPLLEVMREETQEGQGNLGRCLTHALELKARRNQARAEVLLHHKQEQVDVPIQEPTMYLPKEEYDFLEHSAPHQPLPTTLPVKHLPIDAHTDRRRPEKHSGPLRELGSKPYYCEPTNGDQLVMQPTFLTDHGQDEGEVYRRSRWLPLSCSAVEEYEGTHTVPLKIFNSQLGHGKYSMWKPMSSYTYNCEQSIHHLNA